jgi:hypothetical protein
MQAANAEHTDATRFDGKRDNLHHFAQIHHEEGARDEQVAIDL